MPDRESEGEIILAAKPLENLTTSPSKLLEGDDLTFLVVVASVALLFVGYLLVDHFIMRGRAKKFLRKRPPLDD